MNLTRTQWNLLANLLGHGSNAGLAFLVYPWFVFYLGQEAFGVVGFHVSLQATITLFDFGISVAANRELARLSAQPNSAQAMRSLVRSLQRIYWCMALLLGSTLFLLAPILAEHWLQPRELDPAYLANALRWMAVAIALQWPTFLYANCIGGLQRQTLLNGVQLLASLGRYPGALLWLAFASPTLDVYFFNQCCVSFGHTATVMFILWRILPKSERSEASEAIDWKSIRAFAIGVGSISVLNLILTQYDKLLLSTLLPLREFGYYSQAVALVAGLGIIGTPIGAAVFPRFSQMVATHAMDELREIYHHAMQLLSALLLPLSVTMITFGDSLLFVWTGNAVTAQNAATVMRLLAFAMTIYALLSLPNCLQYAHGQTRLLLQIYVVAIAIYLPLGFLMATWHGGEGAAGALSIVLLAMFVLGVPLVHRRLMPGDVLRWYFEDIALPLTPVLALNITVAQFELPTARLELALILVIVILFGMASALAVAPVTRHWLRARSSRVA